jgi:transposase
MSTIPLPATIPTSVHVTETDRARLYTMVHRGHTSARTRTRAQVLLKLGEGWSDLAVRDAFGVCRNTVKRLRARFAAGGVDAVLADQVQERRRQALTGEQQAHLIAIACSPVPEGHDHWTLRLLAGKAVELGFVSGISPETVRALLRRTSSSRGNTTSGASRR